MHETTSFLLVTLPNIHRLLFFHWHIQQWTFWIWLSIIPPHQKYVVTLPCNWLLIAYFLTLVFHKVAWQHMQGIVKLLITTLYRQFNKNLSVKIWKPVKIWQFVASLLLADPTQRRILLNLCGLKGKESVPIQLAQCCFPGWPFPMLIYKYISDKIYGSNFIKQNSIRNLHVMAWNY